MLFLAGLAMLFSAIQLLAGPINDRCPVTTEQPAESHLTVEFEGRTIGFCCRDCIRKFRESPETYRANLPPVIVLAHDAPQSRLEHPSSQPPQSLSPAERIFRFAGNLHVVAVHFPIALILLAALLEYIGWIGNAPRFLFAARVNFSVGVAGALAAAMLGWIAADNSHYTGEAAATLEWHRWLGLAVVGFAVIGLACVMAEKLNRRVGTAGFRFILILLAVLIIATAHLGGTLIYGPNHLIP
jgi:uncharacterized membrane protein